MVPFVWHRYAAFCYCCATTIGLTVYTSQGKYHVPELTAISVIVYRLLQLKPARGDPLLATMVSKPSDSNITNRAITQILYLEKYTGLVVS